MIGAGAFDRRIIVQRATESRDPGTNAVISTWADHLTDVPALMQQSPGREFLEASQVMSERRALFTVRFADITVRDRLVFDGSAFNISDIREIGRRRFLELQCEAIE